MFDKEFYPTPCEIVAEMHALVSDLKKRLILEPSAGKGDLLKGLYKERIKVIEKSPELKSILKENGFTIIHDDFLSYEKEDIFDCILMNPPFSNGDKHLLHAWDILDHGDIVCLLNAETINNPHTSTRQLLAYLIEEHGKVYYLGDCFAEAERKTGVNVAMVHLQKPKEQGRVYISSDGMQHETDKEFNADEFNDLAVKDVIGNLLIDYNMCKDLLADVLPKIDKLKKCYDRMNQSRYKDELPIYANGATYAYNQCLKTIKISAWKSLFEMTNFENFMTSKVKDDFRKLLENQKGIALNRANIESVLQQLFLNRHNILEACVVESFDYMTRYYKENRMHVEGWKTNDSWKVNKKVILPLVVWHEKKWDGIDYSHSTLDSLCDIDKALASLDGKKFEDIVQMRTVIREKIANKDVFASIFESEYFMLKCYKKGTMHMTFKDPRLWEQFNIVACKGKKWLRK